MATSKPYYVVWKIDKDIYKKGDVVSTHATLASAAAKSRMSPWWTVKAPARKVNPAPRIGTKKPTRASQATGKPPTKRLVKRRKANKAEGYFPNPSEVVNAHRNATPFHVYTVKAGTGPLTGKTVAKPVKLLGSFPTQACAEQFAKVQHVAVGVFKD